MATRVPIHGFDGNAGKKYRKNKSYYEAKPSATVGKPT